jgi:hypothetical protein
VPKIAVCAESSVRTLSCDFCTERPPIRAQNRRNKTVCSLQTPKHQSDGETEAPFLQPPSPSHDRAQSHRPYPSAGPKNSVVTYLQTRVHQGASGFCKTIRFHSTRWGISQSKQPPCSRSSALTSSPRVYYFEHILHLLLR